MVQKVQGEAGKGRSLYYNAFVIYHLVNIVVSLDRILETDEVFFLVCFLVFPCVASRKGEEESRLGVVFLPLYTLGQQVLNPMEPQLRHLLNRHSNSSTIEVVVKGK